MNKQAPELLATAIPGFDEILHGGLPPQRAYLAVGGPGTGKTTFGFHFLAAAHPQPALFVSLGQGAQQLREDFDQLGLVTDHLHIQDLAPGAETSEGNANESYTLLQAWEVEGPSLIDSILSTVEEHAPNRVFLDSTTHLHQLSPDEYQFRKQILALLNRLTSKGITVALSAEADGVADTDLAYLCDGIFQFQFQGQGRKVSVRKLRGHSFSQGEHTLRIEGTGLKVFPRLLPGEHGQTFPREAIPSGVPALDELTHGGINRGTITLISGPTGVGKTTLGIQYMKEGATRGERSVVFTFEENAETLMERLKGIGMPLKEMQDSGHLAVNSVEPLYYNTDEFAHEVRAEVEGNNARIVMIDSLSGFNQSVRGAVDLVEAIHSLCRYLTNMGVTVILINESPVSAAGQMRVTEAGISYLGDTILFLQYVELDGELRKVIGMLKKRSGDFEKTLREFEVTAYGLQVGGPLRGLRGILGGTPEDLERRPPGSETGSP